MLKEIRLKAKYLLLRNLTAEAALNAEINEVKGNIPSITNLATSTALTAIENKIPSVSNLVIKTDYNTKISYIENKVTTDHDHEKYISTKEFNKLTSKHVTVRLAQVILASKSDIANLLKKTDFDHKQKTLNRNVTSNSTKHVLVENEFNELLEKVKAVSTKVLTKDLIYKFRFLIRVKYFSLGTFRNYLVFIPSKKYIKYFSSTTQIDSWKSNGMSGKNIENTFKSDCIFAPIFVDHHLLSDINFNGHCLINSNIFIPKKVIHFVFLTY